MGANGEQGGDANIMSEGDVKLSQAAVMNSIGEKTLKIPLE